jgi:hypothetical protein
MCSRAENPFGSGIFKSVMLVEGKRNVLWLAYCPSHPGNQELLARWTRRGLRRARHNTEELL